MVRSILVKRGHSLEKRINQHKRDSNTKKDIYFWNSIRKNGIDSFVWTILEDNIDDIVLIDELEFHYIKQYETFNKDKGYNLTLGGDGLSSMKGFTWEEFFGVERAKEMKIKSSKSLKGLKKSEGFGEKISIAQTGSGNSMYNKGYKISGDKNGMYGKEGFFKGKKHKKETKEILSNISKNWWKNLTEDEYKEYCKKMSDVKKGKTFKKVECPHCGKIGGYNNMYRYHFDKCKYKLS